MKYSLVILTRNEIDGLKKIFKQIPLKQFDEAFAVDFKSTDGTLNFFRKNGVEVIRQKQIGRGEAFKVALNNAKGDIIIFFSPDGNEDPRDLVKFREYFEKNDCDLVIASRMTKLAYNEEDEQIIKIRKWANNIFNFLANLFFRKEGEYVTDSINGFRGIKRESLAKLALDGEGYTVEYQMTIRAMKQKMKIIEFPTHEYPRVGGESYAKGVPTGLKFVKLFFRELLRDQR